MIYYTHYVLPQYVLKPYTPAKQVDWLNIAACANRRSSKLLGSERAWGEIATANAALGLHDMKG